MSRGADAEKLMTGDCRPISLAFPHVTTEAGKVTTLYGELRNALLRYLVCLGLSGDEAQDVVQDTFLSLHRHMSAGGAQDNIRGWVFRVAHNQARNRQKSYHRRFGEPLDQQVDSIVDETTPEHVVLEQEKFKLLENALRSLTVPERECVLLRAAGLRYREIGETLGIPTSTVGDTVERAIKKLTEILHV